MRRCRPPTQTRVLAPAEQTTQEQTSRPGDGRRGIRIHSGKIKRRVARFPRLSKPWPTELLAMGRRARPSVAFQRVREARLGA
jgi:hypothetical protein